MITMRRVQTIKKNTYLNIILKSFSDINTKGKQSPKVVNSKKEQELDMTFSDYKSSLKSLTTFEVFRGYVVYVIASSPFLINNSLTLMSLFKKIFGEFIYKSLMNLTFYGQFVAGESLTKIKPLLIKMNNLGVKTMLDYCVEEDLNKDNKSIELDITKKSRSSFYLNEAACERNVDILLQSIYTMSEIKLNKCILAVKMTGLGRPEMIYQLTEIITQARKFVTQLLGVESKKNIMEYKLTEDILLKKLNELGIKDTDMFMKNIVKDSSGVIHLFPWYGIVDGSKGLSDTFRVPSLKEKKMVRLLTQLSPNEEEMFRNMVHRLNTVISAARANNMMAVIDAEQSYFQPAINRLTMELMNIYNKDRVTVLNTYQCYLKNAFDEMFYDLQLSKRQGFAFATKIVRGAYMEQERLRAKELNYEDPTNPNYEATSKMFYNVSMECLKNAKLHNVDPKNKPIFCLIASHNEDSIKDVLNEMKKQNISPSDESFGFGQLMGMKDYITYSLAQNGYTVYKYVPYGPIVEVMPYLGRRLKENKGEIFQTRKEKMMYGKELRRRIFRF